MTKRGMMGGLLILILCCSGCDLGYLFHAAAGQLRLINSSVPIQEVLNERSLAPPEEAKLRLVARIKAFGEEELGLSKTDNYETVYLDSAQRPIYAVSAAPKDRLCRKTWWFPVVGDMPYLGFFELEKAKAERDRLLAQDLDVCIGIADAYSTLGWFIDPVTRNLIQGSTPDLVETILHEMTHTTLYLKGQSAFNEGLAVLVGKVGALRFLREEFGPLHPFTQEAGASIEDERLFSEFLASLMDRLEHLYGSSLSREEKLSLREEIFVQTLDTFQDLKRKFKTDRFSRFGQGSLDNATILAVGLYHRYFPLFETVLKREGGSIREMVLFFREVSKQDGDVLKKTQRWLQGADPHLTHRTSLS